MNALTFAPAVRSKSRLRLGLEGVSGSGKTYSALLIAKGMGGKTAVIDTEHGSASLYSHIHQFDVLNLEAPYAPERYIEAIHAAEQAGYEILIIDSATHEWNGVGGLLEIIDKLAQTKFRGNTYAAWSEGTPRHRKFIDTILQSSLHIIVTMRSKAEYAEQERMGKKSYVKVGTKSEQRDGTEYELTTVLTIALDNTAIASKDRTGLFRDPFTISVDTGKMLLEWLNNGAALQPEIRKEDSSDAGKQQEEASRQLLAKLSSEVGDFEKGFSLCATLPDLADHWNKAQKHIRSYAKDLGSEAVLPFIASASKAKDARKEAIQRETQDATGGFKTVLIDSQGKVITEIDGRLEMDQVVRIGNFDYVVGGATSQSDQAEVRYAKKKEETEPADPGAGGDAAPTDLLGEPAAESAAPPPPAKTRRTRSAAAA